VIKMKIPDETIKEKAFEIFYDNIGEYKITAKIEEQDGNKFVTLDVGKIFMDYNYIKSEVMDEDDPCDECFDSEDLKNCEAYQNCKRKDECDINQEN
jgi:hypothetical protein